MSHRKVRSQGSIPFSWEYKPGVSKSSNASHYDQYSIPIDGTPSTSTAGDSSTNAVVRNNNKVPPPPPCSIRLPPKRSTSLKGLRWWPDDPFLAAYKECTKSGGSKLPVRMKKISFSCKNSCDVRDDKLVRLSNLPTLAKGRIGVRPEFV
ncbi:hypothetical protein HRI_002320900 [Hibiscus trionum]|uniref:Uncharacterized protein n=1 Tax=Hibiscus trionum TaxID=183268 RepID=A0A9W7I0U4_HIBTR|nr:hypothetical protein HRI_002320900 [Hibiscus trionum]